MAAVCAAGGRGDQPGRATAGRPAARARTACCWSHALRQLPANQRQALALHYLFDMPVEEIAREAGVPRGTVKSWLSRGRSRLAALLPGSRAEELEANDVA